MGEDNKVWLNLGENLIDLSLFLTNAANNVLSYVQNKPWTNKRKDSFINAYNAIMLAGVTGALFNEESSRWRLTTKVQPDESNLSRKDLEMLEYAARFILDLMQGITPENNTKKLSKEKTKFVGATAFDNWVSGAKFGGREFSRTEDWNILDERDATTGKRGVAKRLARMREYLTEYRNSLNDDEWDYSESPIGKNTAEVRAKIDTAINALNGKTEVDLDIIDSLNALGIRARDWFDNGLGEYSGYTDESGNPLNWKLWAEIQNQKTESEDRAKFEKQKQLNEALKSSPWFTYGVMTFNKNMQGWTDKDWADRVGTDSATITSKLNDIASRMGNLTPDELSMLLGAFRSQRIRKQQVSKDIYDIIKRSKRYAGLSISRFSQIPGVDGIVLDTVTGLLLYPKNGVILLDSGNWLEGLSSKEIEEKKRTDAENRKPSEDFLFEDYARMTAAAADITSIVASFVPGYGTAVAGVGGLTSLGANLAADWADDSVTAGEFIKNIGINTGLAVVGLVPGLGAATKTGRILGTIAKWIPRIVALSAAGQVALSPEIHKSLQKVTDDPNNLSVNDWKNIGYALSATAGLARGARGIVDYRKYNPAFKGSTKTETHIKTKGGKKIAATQEDVNRINEAGKKGGTKAANEELRKLKGATETDEVDVDFKTGTISKHLSSKVKLESTTSPTEASSRLKAYQRALQIQNERRKANHPVLSKYLPTSYDIYLSAANTTLPSISPIERIKKLWDPVGESKRNLTSTLVEKVSQAVEQTPKQITSRDVQQKRAVAKRYKDVISGKFSNNPVKTNVLSVNYNGVNFSVRKNDNGTFDLFLNGREVNSYNDLTSLELKNLVAQLVKKHRISTGKGRSKLKEASVKETGKVLQELKKRGWLKQGGQITLDETISNFLKKLK